MFIGDIVRMHGRRFRDKTAVIDENGQLSFGEMNSQVNQIIHALRARGLQKGDRVAVLLYNCNAYAEILLTALKAGFVLVPLNYRLLAKEFAFILKDSEPKAFFFSGDFAKPIESIKEELGFIKEFITVDEDHKTSNSGSLNEIIKNHPGDEPTTDISGDDLAIIMYTSGTTGHPKGVMITHKNIMAGLLNQFTETCPAPEDVIFNLPPFYHAGGIDPFLFHFYRGCTHITIKQFDPLKVLQWTEEKRPTIANLVPAMQNMIINYPEVAQYDLSSLKVMCYGASAMLVAQLKQSMRLFAGCRYFQVGGLTESTAPITILRPEDHVIEGPPERTARLGSAGREVMGCEVKIVDQDDRECPSGVPGEEVVRGDCVMTGYWGMPDETAKTIRDGWLHTGDICVRDEDGFIYYVDRMKDIINRGGENVYPREIEEVIATHPGVMEVAVIGVPDERLHEEIKAVIVPKPGCTIREEEIIDLCKKNLAPFKKPRSIEFVGELPKNPSGKILKRELRKKYMDPQTA